MKAQLNIQTENEICLLYNKNSEMSPNEVPLLNRSVPVTVDPKTVNRAAVYAQAFSAISQIQNPTIKAVIVSADPYFNQTAADLVQAANNWISQLPAQRAVCYPLQEYSQHGPT